jgi:Protein kinase domain
MGSEHPPFMFAKLSPYNEAAIHTYSRTVDAVLGDPMRFAHQRQFMSFSTVQVPINTVLRGRSAPTSSTESDTELGSKPAEAGARDLVWSGCYVFSLQHLPARPTAGWRAGKGRWNLPLGDVDMLLSYNMPETEIRGSHAWFLFERISGIFCVQARHFGRESVRINADSLTPQDGPRTLSKSSKIIQLGKLEFEFAYTIEANSDEEIQFQQQKQNFFRDYLNSPPPIEATSATPSENDITIGPWTLHGPIGRGTYGVVSAASHHNSGEVAAFKTFLRYNGPTSQNVTTEVSVAYALKSLLEPHKYGKYILKLKEIIYQRGKPEYDGTGPENVYLLCDPLARGTFQNLLAAKTQEPVPEATRLALFKQVLMGVSALHANDWTHRDIKPSNLGVVSLDPPKAVILDLGQACQLQPRGDNSQSGIAPQPGHVGTVMYLAPEMETKPYNDKVDIWAFGLVAFELLYGAHPWKTSVNPWKHPVNRAILDTYQRALRQLKDDGSENSIQNLVMLMLLWDPQFRLSADDALQHPALESVAVEQTKPVEAKAGMKRMWGS